MNKNRPLLYINTVTSEISNVKQQEIYDSRYKKKEPEAFFEEKEKSNFVFPEEKKLNNILQMYQKGRPVLCNIITGNNDIVGVPYERVDETLLIKISDENLISVSLKDIATIDIIQF